MLPDGVSKQRGVSLDRGKELRDTSQTQRPLKRVRETASAQKSKVASVLKACGILDCFSHDRAELRLAEIVTCTGLNVTTAHRLLGSLQRTGWIEQTPSHQYRPTIRLFQIGSIALSGLDIRGIVRPALVSLANKFGDTAYLMVPDGPRAVTVEKVEGSYPIRVGIADVGRSLPLHVGAAPTAILAYRKELLPGVLEQGLHRYTDATITSSKELRSFLDETRRRGVSLRAGDVVDGIVAVGAPIFDASDVCIGAISFAGVSERVEARLSEITTAVAETARRLSIGLGASTGRGPGL